MLASLDDLDHPSFGDNYGWSPEPRGEGGALSPEGSPDADATWMQPLEPSHWQDMFAAQESDLLSLAAPLPTRERGASIASTSSATSAASVASSSSARPPAGVVVHLVSDSDANASEAKPREQQKAVAPLMNMDKRSCRLLHAPSFCPALEAYRAQMQQQQQQQHGDGDGTAAMPVDVASRCAPAVGRVAAFVRKRPLLQHERERGDFDAVSVAGGRLVAHICLMKPDLRRMFMRHAAFSLSGNAFDGDATSDEVYGAAAAPLVAHALGGGHAALFMYGQTGSGKTHTMEAMHALVAAQVFAPPHLGFHRVEVMVVEVLGKRCVDLCGSTRAECTLLQQPGGGLELRGATRTAVSSSAELHGVLRRSLAGRSTAATGANATSSRSHALVQISLVHAATADAADYTRQLPSAGSEWRVARAAAASGSEWKAGAEKRAEAARKAEVGRLTLLDCAGSEWTADSSTHCAKRRAESAEINASLHALKQCIRLHAERAQNGGKGHVPFRESVLTRLLAESFEAAETKLVVLGCVAPTATDVEHSVATLRTVMELATASGATEETTTTQVPRLTKVKEPPLRIAF